MRDIAAGRRVRLRHQQYTRAYRAGTATVLSYDAPSETYILARDPGTTLGEDKQSEEWPQHHVFEVDQ